MIDTFRAEIQGLWLPGDKVPNGWTRTENNGRKLTGCEREEWSYIMYQHKASDLRVGGDRVHARWIELSLPKLRFGDNGQLITTPDQLEESLVHAGHLIRKVVPNFDWITIERLDLVWNFPVEPKIMIRAHRDSRHPLVRKATEEHKDQTLYWRGAKILIRMYNKDLEVWRRAKRLAKQQKKEAPPRPDCKTTRVEIQMRKQAVENHFSKERRVDFSFYDYLACYRKIVYQFQPNPVANLSNYSMLLAQLHADGYKVNGLDILDAVTIGKSRSTTWRWRKKISSLRPQVFKIDWRELVPENKLPGVCHV